MVEGTGQWYLIGLHGDMVLRVRQGMPLGETAAGELSFDPSCAQLELGIADDGDLMLSAVDDHELEFGGGTRCRHERLARDRRPEIRLPHNVLRLVTDFVAPAQANETVEIRAVRPTEDIAQPQLERWSDVPLAESVDVVTPLPPRAHLNLVGNGSGDLRTERRDVRRRRILSPSMAALLVLGGLGFALYLVYPAPREGSLPEPSATASGPSAAPQATPTQLAAVAKDTGGGPGADAETSVVSRASEPPPKVQPVLPPKQQVPAVNAPPVTEPERHDGVAEQPAVRLAAPAVRLAEPEPMAAPPTPIVQPRVKRPSIPTVAKTAGADTAVAIRSQPEAEAVAQPEELSAMAQTPTVDVTGAPVTADQALAQGGLTTPATGADTAVTIGSHPEAAVVDEREERSAMIQPPTVDVTRTLFAADQALAQGRLTTPAEANAYTLYNRVLAVNPESVEARTGLKSVRQGLINRALAQLASGALEDARMSLQAATEVGADPSLVTHLRDEVNYRQQVVNARAEQHE